MSVVFHDRGAPELPKPVAPPAPTPAEEPPPAPDPVGEQAPSSEPEPSPSSEPDPELVSWSELAPPSTRPETPAAKAAVKP